MRVGHPSCKTLSRERERSFSTSEVDSCMLTSVSVSILLIPVFLSSRQVSESEQEEEGVCMSWPSRCLLVCFCACVRKEGRGL